MGSDAKQSRTVKRAPYGKLSNGLTRAKIRKAIKETTKARQNDIAKSAPYFDQFGREDE